MRKITMKLGPLYFVVALPLAACGGEADRSEEPGAAAEESAAGVESADTSGYTVVDVADGGTIRGTVRFVGTVPAPRTVSVTEDTETCGETQIMQLVQVGSQDGLANAVASLVDISRGAALEQATPPALDQRGCRFAPHVVIAAAGEPVHVLNNDPFTHNVHTVSFDNRPVNRAQPRSLTQIEVTFNVPEKVRVKCDIHAWMSAWIVVVDHPYQAITDEGGSFVIENVPPGTYTLEVWHESVGASTQSVTVTAGQVTDLSVEMTPSN